MSSSEVERRLDQHAQVGQFLVQFADGARELALQRTHRRTGSTGRCSVDQVGNRLGLGKVHLAVEEGTSAEFARFGQPRQDPGSGRAAVAGRPGRHGPQFEDILAGKGMGDWESRAAGRCRWCCHLPPGSRPASRNGAWVICRSAQSKGQQIAARNAMTPTPPRPGAVAMAAMVPLFTPQAFASLAALPIRSCG